MLTSFDKAPIQQSIIGKLHRYYGCDLKHATQEQLYKALAMTVRDQIMEKYAIERTTKRLKKGKKLYYLSIEFLMGRALHNNMLNLVKTEAYEQALTELGIDLHDLEEFESDPGLGNGGLGRLAACFMDSLSTLGLPATGCSIRFEYGLFRQKIVEGQQVELPDNWLDDGNIWEIAVPEDQIEIHFGGNIEEDWSSGTLKIRHVNYKTVLAVPYDMPVIGYDSDTVNVLRLWSAHSKNRIDMASFSRGQYTLAMQEREMAEVISKMLYPDDHHNEGKELRLRQHYFLASATVQYIVKRYKEVNGDDFTNFANKIAIHINDTHPGLAIPELVRILVDEEDISFEQAIEITTKTFAYTNHTIMAEALECWPEDMVKYQLPRIYQILQELNEYVCTRLWEAYPGQWEKIGQLSILGYGQVRMAHLCISLSHCVNGVSQLHADILKNDTFHDFYVMEPQKFMGITNGVTHRRWLMASNERLTRLMCEAIGDEWIREPERIAELAPFANDAAFREKFRAIKQKNKNLLANWLLEKQGDKVDPTTIFDVQAKRLHEYKRQLMNALHILLLYNRIVDDPNYEILPRTFIFGAKAAPGYYRAKLIIRFIHALKDLIQSHPRASKLLNVVFLENYGVTPAQILIPATEVSEQISTASKEASGTGNMKFMMNGALTIGTLDGANIEMQEAVGPENIYIFGLTADEVLQLYRLGYRSYEVYEGNPEIRRMLEQMIDGTLSPGNTRMFADLYHSLLFGDGGGMADPYFVLKDFNSYELTQKRIQDDYSNPDKWWRMAILNTAYSGVFSSDRTITEYNERIWHLSPVFSREN